MNNFSLKKVVVRYFDSQNLNYEVICRYKNLKNENLGHENLDNRNFNSLEGSLSLIQRIRVALYNYPNFYSVEIGHCKTHSKNVNGTHLNFIIKHQRLLEGISAFGRTRNNFFSTKKERFFDDANKKVKILRFKML